jgi:hypothetical protein
MTPWLIFVGLVIGTIQPHEPESLPPLRSVDGPWTIEEIWSGYDPRKEPLEAETIKEWEDGEIVCRIVRFRVGIFKGKKSLVGGLLAFPRGASGLPGLVQVHGGGQSANLNAATTNSRRGYACLSLNWGGNRLNDGQYRPLWENPVTDWGAVDATHPPQRDPVNHFAVLTPNEFTLDAFESPRNSAWLLVAIAVRRALTFLEQLPQVDGGKLGVYGHSMGAKLTVMVAAVDERVKAAVPSCGGISDYPSEPHFENSKYCRRLNCPVLFLAPVNDFYGRVDDLNQAAAALPDSSFRFVCAPNLDHRDKPDHFVCGPLWFDAQLRGMDALPRTPAVVLDLDSPRRVPRMKITVDESRPIRSADVYFTQQTRDPKNTNPYWHWVPASRVGNGWEAELPLWTLDRPLRAYANVTYELGQSISGAGYYYGLYTSDAFTLSSPLQNASVERLGDSGVMASDLPSRVIEPFEAGWQRGWYVFNENGSWPYRTNRVRDPKWAAPPGAKLVLEVQSPVDGRLVLAFDQFAAECQLAGGSDWQVITLACSDFHDAVDRPLDDWTTVSEFIIADKLSLKSGDTTRMVGADWTGDLPRFRQLRWEP